MKQAYREKYQTYKVHGQNFAHGVHRRTLSTPKKVILSVSVLAVVALVVVQFFYSADKMLPFASIDAVAVGGMEKRAAIEKLDGEYGKVEVPVYFSGHKSKPKVTPHFADLGIKVSNETRVDEYSYPWYMRIVPSSLFWYGLIDQSGEVAVARDAKKLDVYFAKYFGADCTLQPVNAGLAVKDGALSVTPAVTGGTCDYAELHPKLENVAVTRSPEQIVVKGTTTAPTITDKKANDEKDRLSALLKDGVTIAVADKPHTIESKLIYDWMQFSNEGDALSVVLDGAKSASWLDEQYGKTLAAEAGTTQVKTYNFTEISRVPGRNGQALDTDRTRQDIEAVLAGKKNTATAVPRVVTPRVVYERSYSPTDEGLSALMKNFAESNPGTYGVSMVELTGQKRRAEYNATTQFTTASTYKLFVAYSAMLRVEDGRWRLTDKVVGDRDVAKCIDDALVLSDNACPSEMLRRMGYKEVTNEARAIGATSTSFLGGDGIKSTARDEATFMGALYSGQLLRDQSSRDRLIGALKRNIYRKGIPTGVPGVAVANKVGFLDALLHDASIVYSPNGAYVLVILTNNSSWAKIAELTKQIEALRQG